MEQVLAQASELEAGERRLADAKRNSEELDARLAKVSSWHCFELELGVPKSMLLLETRREDLPVQ